MLIFKSCPKCKGDVVIDWDYYGWYEQCIQCGYLCDLKEMLKVRQRPTQEAKNNSSAGNYEIRKQS